jgi:hypothetical protein
MWSSTTGASTSAAGAMSAPSSRRADGGMSTGMLFDAVVDDRSG